MALLGSSHVTRRLAAGAAVAVVLAAGATSAASGHEGDPNIQTVIEGLTPSVSGVTVAIVQGNIVPAVSAYDPTRTELEVLGSDGAPFLRLGPGGTAGNAASPDFYLSQFPSGEASVPKGVRVGAPPRWVALSHRPAWAWFDERVPALGAAPPAVRARTTATLLRRFTIPMRYGVRSVQAEGVVTYVPPSGGVVATLTSPAQPAPGVTAAVLPGSSPDVYLQNEGPGTVTIIGQAGEPFAQIGPGGTRVNTRSPVYDADLSARGESTTVRPDPGGAPSWKQVSGAPTFDWFDPRVRYLAHWSIPLRIGERTTALTGVLRFAAPVTPASLAASARRRHATSPGPPAVLLAALAAAVAVVLALGTSYGYRRRRSRARSHGFVQRQG